MANIGNTFVSKITSQGDMDAFVKELNVTSDIVLVKPNWVDERPGTHTDAKVLDMLLTSLDRKVIIIESYSYWRTTGIKNTGKHEFTFEHGTLEEGKNHWDFFVEQDKKFLSSTGIDAVLDKHGAEYLNITNEIYNNRAVDPEKIRSLVEAAYSPVRIKDHYSNVPEKIFNLKGSDLISFSKAKIDSAYGTSLSIKNLFGLIPDPTRFAKYHGGDPELLLAQSIVDINKVYRSLFNVKYTIEGVFERCNMNWDTGKSELFTNWGTILGGSDGLEVDSLGAKLLRTDFNNALKDLLSIYKATFGGNDSADGDQIPKEYFI